MDKTRGSDPAALPLATQVGFGLMIRGANYLQPRAKAPETVLMSWEAEANTCTMKFLG